MSKSEDLIDIEAVLYRYSRAMDHREWHLMNDVFTEDATADMGGAMFPKGREQVVRLIRTAIECCSVTHHMNSNIEAVIEGDRARVTNNFRAWHRGKEGREHLVYEALGYYIDDFVRTDEGWRIKHRAEINPIEIGDQAGFFIEAMPLFEAMAGRSADAD